MVFFITTSSIVDQNVIFFPEASAVPVEVMIIVPMLSTHEPTYFFL